MKIKCQQKIYINVNPSIKRGLLITAYATATEFTTFINLVKSGLNVTVIN